MADKLALAKIWERQALDLIKTGKRLANEAEALRKEAEEEIKMELSRKELFGPKEGNT